MYVVNYMPIKNQPSILMNKKSCEMGKPSAPRKGRFVVHRGVDPRIWATPRSVTHKFVSSFEFVVDLFKD